MIFNKLDVPHQWKDSFTKYPHGYTIFEALCSWTKQVNNMVDNQNKWNKYLDNFVKNFEFELQEEVKETITRWQNDGLLDSIIESALNTELDNVKAQLEEITYNAKSFGAKGDGVTNDTLAIQNAIDTIPSNSTLLFSGGFLVDNITVKQGINLKGGNIKIRGLWTLKGNNDISGVTFDGGNVYGRFLKFDGDNINVHNNNFINAKETETYLRMIDINPNLSNLTIENNVFDGLEVFDDGHIGGDIGSARAILARGGLTNCVIKNNVFRNMKGLEDGDYIHIQSEQISTSDPFFSDGYYWSNTDVTIENNKFYDTKKSSVKLQASGCKIKNNEVYGSVTEGLSIYTAIRGYNIKDIDIVDNIIDFRGNMKDNVFTIERGENINIINNTIYDSDTIPPSQNYNYTFSIRNIRDSHIESNKTYKNKNQPNPPRNLMSNISNTDIVNNKFEDARFDFYGVINNVNIIKNVFKGYEQSVILNVTASDVTNLIISENNVESSYKFLVNDSTATTSIYLLKNTIHFDGGSTYLIIESNSKQNVIVGGNISNVSNILRTGTTSQRLYANSYRRLVGERYLDTTLGKDLIWNGTDWIDETGTVV